VLIRICDVRSESARDVTCNTTGESTKRRFRPRRDICKETIFESPNIQLPDRFRQRGLTSAWWLSFSSVSSVLNCRSLTKPFVPFRPTLKNHMRSLTL